MRIRMLDEHGRLLRHMRLFYRRQMVFGTAAPVDPEGEVLIVQALSGG